MTKPDEDEPENDPYPVRRAVVPAPGYLLAMLDFDQQEYRIMLDYAGAQSVIRKILNENLDVHQATADGAGITRKDAKTVNFSILFGSGLDLLSARLKVSRAEAARIKGLVFDAAPEIQAFIQQAMRIADRRGYVVNWLGRRSHFDDPRFCYRAPNAIIQGGAADVVKVGMNRISDRLRGMKTRMIMNVHDEVVLEVHESELSVISEVKAILEGVYPQRYLPLTVSASYSTKSLADKVEGLPT